MLEKYSAFMMLLIVTASLVGIGSSIYKPVNVETQPVQPQQTPGLVTREQSINIPQAMADKQLLDRLFPLIMNRIDSDTILQKIDMRKLVTKLTPHMEVRLNLRDAWSPELKVSKLGPFPASTYHQTQVRCPNTFRIMGGGVQITEAVALPPQSVGNNIVTLMMLPPATLNAKVKMESGGSIMAHAVCLSNTLGVTLREPVQPEPTPPPGGPPLQPPASVSGQLESKPC